MYATIYRDATRITARAKYVQLNAPGCVVVKTPVAKVDLNYIYNVMIVTSSNRVGT